MIFFTGKCFLEIFNQWFINKSNKYPVRKYPRKEYSKKLYSRKNIGFKLESEELFTGLFIFDDVFVLRNIISSNNYLEIFSRGT